MWLDVKKIRTPSWLLMQREVYRNEIRSTTRTYFCINVCWWLKKVVPVFQMISADQRSFQIANFLRLILSKDVPHPPIVVCDFGRALVNAVAEVFGRCNDLSNYLQICYNAVVKNSSVIPILLSYLRLDVSHLIAMVSWWKCLKTKVASARRLYLRCVSQAYQMHDFETLTYFIKSMLAVSLSEFIGNTHDGIAVPAEICMQVLNKTIQGIRGRKWAYRKR